MLGQLLRSSTLLGRLEVEKTLVGEPNKYLECLTAFMFEKHGNEFERLDLDDELH